MLLPGSNSVLIAGGDLYEDGHTLNKGNSDANLFSGTDDDLTPDGSGSMKRKRWYSTTITLVNGETYIQGGKGSGPNGTAGYIRPEVRGLDAKYRLLSNINTSTLSFYYPRQIPRHGILPASLQTLPPALMKSSRGSSKGSCSIPRCARTSAREPDVERGAKRLGISRSSLYQKINRYQLQSKI